MTGMHGDVAYMVTQDCSFAFKDPTHSGSIQKVFDVTTITADGKGIDGKVVAGGILTLINGTNGTVTGGTGTINWEVSDSGAKVWVWNVTKQKLVPVMHTDWEQDMLVTGVIGSTPATYTTTIILWSPGQYRVEVKP